MARLAAEIEQQAATWLARREAEGWSSSDEAALAVWRGAATEHHLALLRLETAWRKADRLRAVGAGGAAPAAGEPVKPDEVQVPRRGRWPLWTAGLAAAASLALLAGSGWNLLTAPAAEAYATQVGGFQRLPLADGSRVEINTDTRLEVALGAAERHVSLDRGEAFFSVAHDPARPFVVEAGDYRVTAVGTAFSVRLDGARIQVVVTEGRVRVDRGDGAAAAPLVLLAAGQRISALPSAPVAVEAVDPAVIEQALSWRDGLLVFEDTPLRAAAAEFNRYNGRQLAVDPAVAEVEVSGSFRANNVDGFVRLLEQGFGVAAAPDARGAVMLRRR